MAEAKTDSWEVLISRARRMDPDAFDVIVEEYSARLYGFLYRLTGQPEEAEDLVQEVFVRVVRMIAQYEHHGRFEPWLFRIAGNLAKDRLRKIRRAPTTLSLDASDGGGEGGEPAGQGLGERCRSGPEDALERAENVDRMQRALARLPEAEREVILLRHYGRMSFAEISEMMEIPLGTALARAHRGLGKLRGWMESQG